MSQNVAPANPACGWPVEDALATRHWFLTLTPYQTPVFTPTLIPFTPGRVASILAELRACLELSARRGAHERRLLQPQPEALSLARSIPADPRTQEATTQSAPNSCRPPSR
jgi:hypothetical protein